MSLLLQYNVLRRIRPLWCSLASMCFSLYCTTVSGDALTNKINAIEQQSHTTMGITAIYIEKNKAVNYKSNQRFFMASTIKLPIALAFLHRVDKKQDSLDRVVKMDVKNSVPGSGSLYHLFEKKKLSMSMKQILSYMLKNSDNSASDTILHAVHGPKYVAQRMNDLGFKNIYVNRSILEMFMDTNHVNSALLNKKQPVHVWERTFSRVPLAQKHDAWKHFQNDIRDTTTSNDMAKLLVKVYRNQTLSESSTKLLMAIMEQCRTGRSRIKGLLPAQVRVAHKTGTWSIYERDYLRYPGSKQLYRFASDVGIITLPNHKGHIAIAVYVKSRGASDYPRSHAIALASRAIYDHFMKIS